MKFEIKMKLKFGNEKDLFRFLSEINNEKTALISHVDLDGITAAKIAGEVIDFSILKFIEYEGLNDNLIEELKKNEITIVIFTDLYVKDETFMKNLESFAKVLILDHHLSPDWNSKKTVCINGEEGYSAGYLCHYLFSKIKNLEKWDWLVACSCISDYCHVKPKEWLEKIFKKYGDKLEYKRDYVRKDGKIWDLQYTLSLSLVYFKNKDMKEVYNFLKPDLEDISILKKCADEVKKDIDQTLKEFEDKKEDIKDGYFFENNSKFSINSIVSSILSGADSHKLFVIIKPEKYFYRISARRQDKKFNCSKFLQDLVKGLQNGDAGGHAAAAGGHFMKKDLSEFRRRLGLSNKKI